MAGVFSVGHSSVPKEKLLERLQAHRIDRVIDVRTKPYSRFNPQYNRAALEAYLTANGIVYDFRGSQLGGLSENVNYDETLLEVSKLAETENIVLLCSEKDHKKCHRFTMLTPDLEALGASITHITYE